MEVVVCFCTICSLSHSPPSVVVQLPSRVWLFVTLWTAALQAPLSSTVSQSLLVSTDLVMQEKYMLSFCLLS